MILSRDMSGGGTRSASFQNVPPGAVLRLRRIGDEVITSYSTHAFDFVEVDRKRLDGLASRVQAGIAATGKDMNLEEKFVPLLATVSEPMVQEVAPSFRRGDADSGGGIDVS